MMGCSQKPEDTRTPDQILQDIIKKYPINTYWYYETNWGGELQKHYHWISGYHTIKGRSKDIRIQSSSLNYSNETFCTKNDDCFFEDNNYGFEKITEDEFNKIETKLKTAYNFIGSKYRLLQDFFDTHQQIKVTDMKLDTKYIQRVNRNVIKIGEYKGEFKANNGKFDDEYNCLSRHFTMSCENEKLFLYITQSDNWKIHDTDDIFIVSEDEYMELNNYFDEMLIGYNGFMCCDTEEELGNYFRNKRLEKILE